MLLLAPAMGYFHLSEFDTGDLTTSDCEMVHLTGIGSGGVKLGAY